MVSVSRLRESISYVSPSALKGLKEKGLASPYLKAFVVARVNPTRFSKAREFDFDEVMGKMPPRPDVSR